MERTDRANRVLWISRHTMTPEQYSDLERIADGPVELIPWTDTVKEAAELEGAIEKADLIAAVLPTELLAQVLRLAEGKPVLQSVSGRVSLPETGSGERQFAFVHAYWQRILRLDWAAERL